MRKLRFFIFGSALAAAASLGLQLPASAAVQGATLLPTAKIVANAKGVTKYKPTSLAATWSAATTVSCSRKRIRAWVKNKTTATQTMTYNGSTFAQVSAGGKVGICFYGSGTFSFVFGLTGSTSTLTVNVS